MIRHPHMNLLLLAEEASRVPPSLLDYLKSMQHVHTHVTSQLPNDLGNHTVVITLGGFGAEDNISRLEAFVRNGGGWLSLVQACDEFIPGLFGVRLYPLGPRTELRVIFQSCSHPIAVRLPASFYVTDEYRSLVIDSLDTETILYVDWHYEHSPVMVSRSVGRGLAACTTLKTYEDSSFRQILYRLLRYLAGHHPPNRCLGVGLLGYPPWLGKNHALGVQATPGLVMHAVCDINPERLAESNKLLPQLKTYTNARSLADDPQVDVVIVSTPPNTHAELSIAMMAAGKHVICEKPLALNKQETTKMLETAEKYDVHLSCHQNRRWDVDYLAIKQALSDRLLGDLFYMETFVGGYHHPCGYWHSHCGISGGTTYDWGGHYLDWIVSLIPDRVIAVIGTRQNRVWHDITNADHERIQVRFQGGQEAEFLHCDIAAIRKPKWYLLGTEGAIVGNWHDATVYGIDPVQYFHQHHIPSTEMPPDLTLHRRHHSGQIVLQKLAVPSRNPYLFHRNLADHLLTGEPIAAPVEQSVTVVAILEAAARSAAKGGTLELLND